MHIILLWERLVGKPVTAVTSRVFRSQYQVDVPVSDPLPSAMKIMLIILSGKRWRGANQTLKHTIAPELG